MSLNIPESAPPTGVELDRERQLAITWADGTQAAFALVTLRANCPCAECRGRRDQGQPTYQTDAEVRALDAELVGNWGITIRWADGHSTGIFSWGILRAWAEPD